MAMEYINYIKAKTHLSLAPKSEAPVLSEEDEHFLNRITSDVEAPPPLPARPNAQFLPCAGDTKSNDAQSALMNGAQNIPLPDTPTEWTDEPTIVEVSGTSTEETTSKKSGRPTWSWLRRDSRDTKRKNQEAAAGGLTDVAAALKPADAKPNEDKVVEDREAKKEEEDMTIVLERLNLAAVNNRVFSISDETQELLQKFNQIFKDLVNGVPTAYDDLESLLTNGDRQLQRTFSNLPSFLQKLIETLPAKMTQGFAPEIIAAAAERAERSGVNMQTAGKAAAAAKKMGFKTPSLKDMIGKPGAVATMMRSIIGFLRARFPAFLGMNVLWSLALFVLLFVFWYCHKRGREVRLERERRLTEEEAAKLEKDYAGLDLDDVPTTTAAEGASMEEVKEGMKEVQTARQAAFELSEDMPDENAPSTLSSTVQPAERVGT